MKFLKIEAYLSSIFVNVLKIYPDYVWIVAEELFDTFCPLNAADAYHLQLYYQTAELHQYCAKV